MKFMRRADMGHLQSFLTKLGERVTRLILDPGCVKGIIVIIIFVYAIVNIIWVIVERRKKRATQTRQNGRAGFDSPVQEHDWESYRQPESRRSAEPAPPVKQQIQRYVRERMRELLQ